MIAELFPRNRTPSLIQLTTATPLLCAHCVLQPLLHADECPAPGFAAARSYQPTDRFGSRPASVALGDFNRDGRIDLAVALAANASASPGNLAILLNKGDGTLGTGTNFGFGDGPGDSATSVAVGDLNGDGKLDLVAADTGSTKISVVLGNGDGTFGNPTNFLVGLKPTAVILGDFNRDGRADAIVANAGSTNVSILLGVGDGSFQPASDFPTVASPGCVAAGDFNRDGKLDLAVANTGSTNLSVLLGKGDGTFLPATNYVTGQAPASIAVGDFNHDGKLDLAVASLGSFNPGGVTNSGGSTLILLGQGDGSFLMGTNYTFTSSARGVATGDWNGDGHLDLTIVHGQPDRNSQSIDVMLGNGDGSFRAPDSFTAGYNPIFVTAGDVDSDGKPDLVVANSDQQSSGSIATLLGKGDGTFWSPIRHVGTNPYEQFGRMAAGDFNGDGRPDLVVPDLDGDGQSLSVLIGNGDGSFQSGANFFIQSTANGETVAAAVGDYNGDRKPDLAVTGKDGAVSILLGKGDGTFQSAATFPTEPYSSVIATGDFNHDNKLDLVITTLSGPIISLLTGNGDGTFQTASNFPAGGPGYALVVGDLNGDTNLDVAITSFSGIGSPGRLSVILGNGDGTFRTPVPYEVGIMPWSLSAGDFNGDGKPDLAAASVYPGEGVSVLINNGDGTFQAATNYPVSGGLNCLASGDFNGDGKMDLATGMDGAMALLFGVGDGSFQSPVFYGAARRLTAPCDCAIADFNGDGALDLAGHGSGVSVVLNLCAPIRPNLSIARAASEIKLFWPYPSAGFVLQSTTNLGLPGWLPLIESPQTNSGSLEVTLPTAGPERWYRLRKP